ncbi:MAG: hypothetical protein APF84_08395 [Gracilibacter sp. BRH_c7a]|nr:MAG: hypothetical protein APF84_08395 [Gracilibacter sp. BRH_c7a]
MRTAIASHSRIMTILLVLVCIALLMSGCSALGFKQEAKDFTLPDFNGDMVALSDYQDENIYLNFWASWCEPCVQEMPAIEKIYQENKDKGLVILTVNTGEDKATVEEYMKTNGYTFPVLMDLEMEVARQYKTASIPVSFFINKEGKIVTKKEGLMTEEEMRKAIGKLQ